MLPKKAAVTHSSGGVVVSPKGLILVVNQNGNSWSLPKGHIDEGESTLDAAKREIYEESGVQKLQLIKELGTYERPKISIRGGDDVSETKRITLFLFKTTQTILRPVDPENPEARWVNALEVADLLTHPKDKDFFLSILPKIKDV